MCDWKKVAKQNMPKMAGRGLAHASLNRSFLKTFKQLSISIKLVCQE